MNSIELQLWKNHELNTEKALAQDIEWRKQRLANRKGFIEALDRRLGEFFPDLIAGPVEERSVASLIHTVKICYHGVEGYIEQEDSYRLRIHIGTETSYLSDHSLKSTQEIADWLERWTTK